MIGVQPPTNASQGETINLLELLLAKLAAVITCELQPWQRRASDARRSTEELRLRALCLGWGDICRREESTSTERARDSFINTCFTFSKPLPASLDHAKCQNFITYLKALDLVKSSRYGRPSDPQSGDTASSTSASEDAEPTPTLHAAQAIYRALSSSCKKRLDAQHQFGARLRLGTYCAWGDVESKLANPGGSELGILMLYSGSKKVWQEVVVHVLRDVYKAPDGSQDQPGEHAAKRHKPETSAPSPKTKNVQLDHLCVVSWYFEKYHPYFINYNLKAHEDTLIQPGPELRVSEDKCFNIKKAPVSLLSLLEHAHQNGAPIFDDIRKAVLGVPIIHALFDLHDTPWLQGTWSSKDIVFHYTGPEASKLQLAPFLDWHPPETQQLPADSPDSDDEMGDFGDDHSHPGPSLVALAIILIEIQLGKPFQAIAQEYSPSLNLDDMRLSEKHIHIKTLYDASCKGTVFVRAFRQVVPKCLNGEFWAQFETSLAVDDDCALRAAIHGEVVRPLKAQLKSSYLGDDIQESIKQHGSFDKFAQENISIDISSLNNFTMGIRPKANPSPASINEPSLEAGSDGGNMMSTDSKRSDAKKRYMQWKEDFGKVYSEFVEKPIRDARPAFKLDPVRIAVLDTGIDMDHPSMRDSYHETIKQRRCWLPGEGEKDVEDNAGHGTFVAGLVLDYTPDAEVYIAKIAHQEAGPPSEIAKAIRHAVDEWKVDIINMSFGYSSNAIEGYRDLREAIEYAHGHRVLLFAAAANEGDQTWRSWPAQHDEVICVHWTDTSGKGAKGSPTAKPDSVNLATVGEDVVSACPRTLWLRDCQRRGEPDRNVYTRTQSGASHATAIMSGLAGFLLTYARLHVPDQAREFKKKKHMVALLKHTSVKEPSGHVFPTSDGYYFVDIRRHSHALFGKGKEEINTKFRSIAAD